MSLTINTNAASISAQRSLASSQGSMMVSMQRLSSGLRVNSAKDDAAGLAIAERMNTQVRGMTVAIRNANDGISMAQTADGALSQINEMFQRMRELAVQAANSTNTISDGASLQAEFVQLRDEIRRTVSTTTFNGLQVVGGLGIGATGFQVGFQVGPNAGEQVVVTAPNILENIFTNAVLTTAGAAIDITLAVNAAAALPVIDFALDVVNSGRANYGAVLNRFEAIVSTLRVTAENQSAARGRIMDADFAQETANLARAQILQQAGTAMVAQANQLPQQVLQLLR